VIKKLALFKPFKPFDTVFTTYSGRTEFFNWSSFKTRRYATIQGFNGSNFQRRIRKNTVPIVPDDPSVPAFRTRSSVQTFKGFRTGNILAL